MEYKEEKQIAGKEGRPQALKRGKCVLIADHEVGGQRPWAAVSHRRRIPPTRENGGKA